MENQNLFVALGWHTIEKQWPFRQHFTMMDIAMRDFFPKWIFYQKENAQIPNVEKENVWSINIPPTLAKLVVFPYHSW